jgi:protein-tyrosine-phosphatase/DNA-binding transcriptional ArsR family regulator
MEARDAAAGFAVLAQETRLRLVRTLATRGASGMSAGEVANHLGVTPSTLSFHLAALERCGLIRSTRQGRHIIYAVRFVGLSELLSFLTETCCAGQPELCRLARLIPDDIDRDATIKPAFNVLFICTRNSARSIMAEAILQKVGGGGFNGYSAGSDPARQPMTEVINRLKAMGHDISYLRSKSWIEFTRPDAPRMDFVLTLCDPGKGEVCPDLGERPITATWPFPDPAKFTGSEIERLALLNQLYGMIRRRLEVFVGLPFKTLGRIALRARLDELGDSSKFAI